ncbi:MULTISPECIES: Tim44/TimA family putative adaptor protein [unclassified Aureimonas]|uniref:Tim44/TimA family putative adaptor protein n=1 Tax=unclassified Aureimonas TaxID=2615206 RepID=UPI0006F609FC|nr:MULTISPECIES: Tim44/TimA family putative adaptor protein [unclassified Aureimonas]KQT52575.1 calcium-binding protein [Aureimonas sp. Leaf427]KQT77524.1 calcium-binding protein [Aureimonas sp. Leaf460]
MGFGTIFFIVLAAVVLFQLRNVLGRRTGNERPPFDPYTRPEKIEGAAPQGNVVTLPRRDQPQAEIVAEDPYEAIDRIVPPSEPANAQLRAVKDADPSFQAKEFTEGAKLAYEMIVTAFAAGDRKTLKSLLSPEVYAGFEAAIVDREAKREVMKSTFVGIDDVRVVGAAVKEREVVVTLRIISQLVSAVQSATGEVVDGDLEAVVEVKDVWTFARDMRSRDPNWKLVATESDGD